MNSGWLKQYGPRATVVALAGAAVLAGGVLAGCGSSDTSSVESTAKKQIEAGTKEAEEGLKEGTKEAEKAVQEAKKEFNGNGSKQVKEGLEKAEKGIEEGKAQAKKGLEEAKKQIEEATK